MIEAYITYIHPVSKVKIKSVSLCVAMDKTSEHAQDYSTSKLQVKSQHCMGNDWIYYVTVIMALSLIMLVSKYSRQIPCTWRKSQGMLVTHAHCIPEKNV